MKNTRWNAPCLRSKCKVNGGMYVMLNFPIWGTGKVLVYTPLGTGNSALLGCYINIVIHERVCQTPLYPRWCTFHHAWASRPSLYTTGNQGDSTCELQSFASTKTLKLNSETAPSIKRRLKWCGGCKGLRLPVYKITGISVGMVKAAQLFTTACAATPQGKAPAYVDHRGASMTGKAGWLAYSGWLSVIVIFWLPVFRKSRSSPS